MSCYSGCLPVPVVWHCPRQPIMYMRPCTCANLEALLADFLIAVMSRVSFQADLVCSGQIHKTEWWQGHGSAGGPCEATQLFCGSGKDEAGMTPWSSQVFRDQQPAL